VVCTSKANIVPYAVAFGPSAAIMVLSALRLAELARDTAQNTDHARIHGIAGSSEAPKPQARKSSVAGSRHQSAQLHLCVVSLSL
jgi:hypothetical protein